MGLPTIRKVEVRFNRGRDFMPHLHHLAFSSDGKRLFAGGWGGSKVSGGFGASWSVSVTPRIALHKEHVFATNTLDVNAIAVAPTGELLLSGGRARGFIGVVNVWPYRTRPDSSSTGTLFEDESLRHSVDSLSISPDGNTLAIGRYEKVQFLRLPTGELFDELFGYGSFKYSADGRLGLAYSNPDMELHILDLRTKNIMYRYKYGKVHDISPLCTHVAVTAGGPISLLDTATCCEMGTLEGPKGDAAIVRFSPIGELLATSHRGLGESSRDGGVYLWNVSTGKRRTLAKWYGVKSLCFSPDGNLLVAGKVGGLIVWDIREASDNLKCGNVEPAVIVARSGQDN